MPNASDLPEDFPLAWERCLNSFLLGLSRQEDRTQLQLARRVLTAFFASVQKPLEDVTSEDISKFSPAWFKKDKHVTAARMMIVEFFAFAATFPFATPTAVPPIKPLEPPVKPVKPTGCMKKL